MPNMEVVRMTDALSTLGPPAGVTQPDTVVTDLLEILRRHLRMDVAGLARIDGDLLVLQVLSGDARGFRLAPGSTIRREHALLGRVLSGEIPEIVADTRTDPRTADAGVVRELGVGAYAAAPVADNDGEVYGIVGCLAHDALPHPRDRDVHFLHLLAAFLSDAVLDLHRLWEQRRRIWQEVSDLIDAGGPKMIFQPIFRLTDERIVGVEALSRFPHTTGDAQQWYNDAATVGLSIELELMAIRHALTVLPTLPSDLTLAVNASPSTITSGLVDILPDRGADRLIVEITEHEHIGDDSELLVAVGVLRRRGVRIAIDDVGTGYAGLEQLIHLRPEIIKLDRVLTHGIDTDPARRAIATGLVQVAGEIGGCVIAEGIETPMELDTAMAAGIPYGQGYLLGHPTTTAGAAWVEHSAHRPTAAEPEPVPATSSRRLG
ncbi:diguanylate phosphodiesterase [Frankia sp. CcI156]|uniref:Diguanylate phosphodiesterase (EAL domain) with GAF sensor n=3 Tax=Frankiaceae TaxID=74712 RepID=Q2JAA4_FRACC|nr:diguanylate phosphodiesterase (EAL domain) with GAF sensor [Frankia casuarinae]ETA03370.1 EAL domain-containing protein [Frankia sp. CcI6]KDA42735.1 EAL domain-containing protein [Frankia sp. BMG5.23]KEZ35958.1 EAL domain-containing protein [Frankia sp. CeD]KFB04169.1 EAL domain-containing protein [Frankia sp. Allo2]OHV56230.1 diguanylate phosphodiesterase [Frankia sp. CgIS1]ONH26914.1 diguanylate phosphodiesterase [Frankia sp. CcI156]ORT48486.1 diguanylate phosphodiesterase [Frankia sp. 